MTMDLVASVPFKAVMRGMLHEDLRPPGPRPIDFGGFCSVVREQMLMPDDAREHFGARSYAIVPGHYLNFSSRVIPMRVQTCDFDKGRQGRRPPPRYGSGGPPCPPFLLVRQRISISCHYSVLDSFCSDSFNKHYITFAFKGGAADEIGRIRRVRAIANIFRASGSSVDVREGRVDARCNKYDMQSTEERLDQVGRPLQFTRQMDMLMHSDAAVNAIAKCFPAGRYSPHPELRSQFHSDTAK